MTDLAAQSEHVLGGCLKLTIAATVVTLFLAATTAFVVYRATARDVPPPGNAGDPARGRVLVSACGCTACHVIPGSSPQGNVGPPLTHFGSRSYIAGQFDNEPITLQQWIRHPQEMKPRTAMPDTGVTQPDARDLAAYLEQLK